jgi:hypothetical protein
MQAPVPLPVNLFAAVSLEAWLTIAALIIGPIAALWIQKYLDNRRARIDRRVKIFRDLMANRASRLSLLYVQALNGIETEFYGQTKVIEAWRVLVDHLNAYHPPMDDARAKAWLEDTTDHLVSLLYEMAESLGYHFDKVTLKRNVYYPTGWNTVETENTQLRQAAVKVFAGEKPLKVELLGENPAPAVPVPVDARRRE